MASISIPPLVVQDIERAYELAGGRGKYQLLVAASCWISFMTMMTFVYSIPLFLIKPPVECFENGNWVPCEATFVCEVQKVPYRYTKPHTFNFVTEFDLLCKDTESALIVSAYFLGTLASCLFVNTLSDMFGRLPMLIFGNLSNCIFIGVLTIFSNYLMSVVVSALIGVAVITNAANSFTYLYDSFPSKYAIFYGATVNVAWGVGQAIIPAIMWSQIEWRTMCYILILISGLFFGLLYWLRESPKFYFCKKMYDQALVKLRHIARINNSPLPSNLVLGGNDIISVPEPKRLTLKEILQALFCSPNILFRMFLFSFCYGASGLEFYGISLNVEKFGGDPYFNGLMMAFAVIISAITVGTLWHLLGKRGSFVFYFGVSAVGVILQGVFEKTTALYLTGIYTGTFGSNAANNSLYLLSADFFPTNIKAAALGVSIFVGRIVTMFSKLMSLLDPFVMCMVLASLSVASGFVSLLFPVGEEGSKGIPVESRSGCSKAKHNERQNGFSENVSSGKNENWCSKQEGTYNLVS
eukprot:TRINITY_DN2509_c0_g1_i1.p1 TRINITY_DN2509_c0_g1~~TRINITY_DN2509_c0_g1_i1.p1  ORF type:complete len:525 (-),score=-0.33 TRINITY_DN2509_c0_g1_i1:147-1721(-)